MDGQRTWTVVTAAMCAVLAASSWATPRAVAGSRERGEPRLRLARERLGPDTSPGDGLVLDIDTRARSALLQRGRATVREFPLPGRAPAELELTQLDVLTPDARLIAVDRGVERELPRPDVRSFSGSLAGEPDSLVVLTFFDRRMAGFVRTWNDEFVIGPDVFDLDRVGAGDDTVRVRRASSDEPAGFDCGGPLDAPFASRFDAPTTLGAGAGARAGGGMLAARPGADAVRARAIDGNTLLEATIAIDATVEFHDHLGSLTATQDYILSLMAQVSAIYESELNVRLRVGLLRVFTSEPDPYTDGSLDTSVLLADLRSEWIAHESSVPRTATHLFSVRPSGGSGLAYIDVLCNGGYGYGVSSISALGQSWEKNLVAHEIGHNFASPHTHCYVPEIDQCANEGGCYQGAIVQTTGTIMSYCNQKQSVFHPRVKTEAIRPAAESAYPTCIETAGLPGSVAAGGSVGAGLRLGKPVACPSASLAWDDGSLNGYYGYGGTAQMAWVKRFTPACHPFALDRVDLLIGHSSVAPGRAIRLLVYVDPAGTGDPADAVLVHTEDVSVGVVSSSTYNQYTLAQPVVVGSGDLYIGAYDLVVDGTDTFIGARDTSREGDSFYTANSTDPGSLSPLAGATWLIRGHGGAVAAGSVTLDWDPACNEATTPNQDYAVYEGTLGAWDDTDSLTCSTGRATTHLAGPTPDSRFYLVVPTTAAAEGSYGLTSAGTERSPAPSSCKPQQIGACE